MIIIEGTVVHGKHLGRTIGFPTANLRAERQTGSGPDGVYAAWFYVDGERLPCMVNIGLHPTLPEGGRSVEAHIFNYSGNLYGKAAHLETVAWLRGEVKFPGPQALKAQLEQDALTCLSILAQSRS